MADIHVSHSAMGSSIFARFAHLVAEARSDFAHWKQYRATLSELRELSNRELADLGLSRSMLKRIALESVYGENI